MPQIRPIGVSGSIPSVNQLALGDIAINTYDGKAYLKKAVGNTQTILEIGVGSTTTTASYAVSASYAQTATTASYTVSASYAANGGVTQLLAGSNITLSPTNGKGQVTISSTGGSGPFYNTATGSYGSFYDTTTQTNPVAGIARSMSINTTDITNGVSISGSTSPYNTYIKTENPGVHDIQFSAQFDRTNSGTDKVYIWLRKNGVDVAESNTSIVLTGGAAANPIVAAWNWFVNSAAGDYYQIMWESGDTHVRLLADPTPTYGPALPSIILTVNRVDQFLSNTGSFSGSFEGFHTGLFTGSFTGSLFGTSSNALTASFPWFQTGSNIAYVGGNVGIGTGTPSARLNVNGTTLLQGGQTTLRGAGTTSATITFRVENANASASITTLDNGATTLTPSANTTPLAISGYSITGSNTQSALDISGSWNTSGFVNLINANITNVASAANSRLIHLSVNGTTQLSCTTGGNLRAASTVFAPSFNADSFPSTNASVFVTSGTFTRSSGTNIFTGVSLSPTINQTGGANGITRGLYVNPTLTSAASWRSIEWSNNTGFGLYGIGGAPNYLSGSLVIGSSSLGASESTLTLGPPPAGGVGEGGQLGLQASGGSYISASFIDVYQDQFRILKGTNAASVSGIMVTDLQTNNTQFLGAISASAYNGLPNDYLYATRNGTSQTVGSAWANTDIIFNNINAFKGIAFNISTGVASLTAGKVYRVTARLAWGAAATYNLQFSCFTSANIQIGPTVEIVQSTNGTSNISDGTLEFIYAPGVNTDIKIRCTNNNTALSGEIIRADLNTQFIIQQIA
jgi:hypothetical protein